jgi:MAPEG family
MDLRSEQRSVALGAIAALTVCAVILSLGYLVLPRWFQFPIDLPARLAFAVRADLFVLLWVVLGIVLVAYGRGRSAADIRGAAVSPPSPAIAVQVAFLQNTLEQAMIAAGAHLALATLLDGAALALIVAAVALFGLGRLAFLAGYARGAGGRAFGMATTFLPTGAGYALAIGLLAHQTCGRWLL